MLDPWIIEEIIRREKEEEERRRGERRIELPLQNPRHHDSGETKVVPPADADRGVTVIDI